jgi:uncharacterized protein (DUF2062 family)
MTAATPLEPPAAEPQKGFWHRRLVRPILRQLTQGVAPRQISFTLAVGGVCALFPFLGFTWLLNLLVGIILKLNQPILQTLNQLMTPIHLPMIFVYVRIGEWIWGAEDSLFSISDLIQQFAELSFMEFLQKFGWAGVHAFTAWTLSIPLIFAAIYFSIRPLIDRLARARQTSQTA